MTCMSSSVRSISCARVSRTTNAVATSRLFAARFSAAVLWARRATYLLLLCWRFRHIAEPPTATETSGLFSIAWSIIIIIISSSSGGGGGGGSSSSSSDSHIVVTRVLQAVTNRKSVVTLREFNYQKSVVIYTIKFNAGYKKLLVFVYLLQDTHF